MGNISNTANLAQDTTFRAQALAALVAQARLIATEDPTIANHQARVLYAQAVVRAPSQYQDSVAWTVAADATIASLGAQAAQIPEAALTAATVNAWNYLAGLYTLPTH